LTGALVEDRREKEEITVAGLGWIFELLTIPRSLGRAGALKTEQLELVCELADPTALRVSPTSDSVSSVEK
jgi:hypothetical protein